MDSPALSLLLEAAGQQSASRIAVYHAQAHPDLYALSQQCDLTLLQSFKPFILDIQAMGLDISALQGEYDLALLVPSKDKKQSLGWMADALLHLKADGKLMVACENQYGAKSYEAALKKLAGQTASTSKSKCRLFSAKKTPKLDAALQKQWIEEAKPHVISSHGLWAQAGLFSWKKADVGSQMLLKHLPQLSGKVMDLCCGYGLLAADIKKHEDVSEIHLVEADSLALACAEKNMQGLEKAVYHHVDAVVEALPAHMNAMVCNPPFHTGQTRDVALGEKIVSKACGALTHGGELYLVANRQLPYEHILKAHLRSMQTLAQGDGFKVIWGKK